MTHLKEVYSKYIQRGAEHGTKANHYSHDLCCNTPVGTVTCLLIKQIWKQCDQILSPGNSFQKWISAFKLTMWLVIFFNDIHQKRDSFYRYIQYLWNLTFFWKIFFLLSSISGNTRNLKAAIGNLGFPGFSHNGKVLLYLEPKV